MDDRNLLYVAALVVATALSLAIATYAIANDDRRRKLRWLLAAMMVVTAVWSSSSAMTHLTTDPGATLDWHALANASTFVLPVVWVLFALEFAGYRRFVSPLAIAALFLVPTIAFASMVTNYAHGLFLREVGVSANGAYVEQTPGHLYDAHLAYAYLLILVGLIVLAHRAYVTRRIYRAQAAAIVVAVVVPLIVNVAYTSGVTPQRFNLTPVAFSLSGLAIAAAVFRYRLLDLLPVARETLVETMRDGFVVLDDQRRIVDVNKAGEELVDGTISLGRSAEAVQVGSLPLSTILDDDAEEISISRPDGKRYLRARQTDLSKIGDGVRGGTMVLFQDVTKRRRTERRFQRLIEHATDVVTVLDGDGTISYQSPSIRRVLGYEPSEMVGESAFEYVHPEDRPELLERFERTAPGQMVRTEFRMRHADGPWRILDANGRNLLDDPLVEGFVVNSRDVTERRERERELERTNERLDEFASVVSHDLRNPLNVSEGYLELLDERVEDDALDVVREQQRRMRAIIDDALTLAREGERVEETTTLSLEVVARVAWGNVETEDATLSVDGDCTFEANRTRVLRALENLFRNSVEHGRSGGEDDHGSDASVHVGVTDAGFYVADDGPGIPSEKRDRVFDSGFSSNEEGTGFGLAIVGQIAAAHGWTVSVTDDLDVPVDGACLEFDLREESPSTGEWNVLDETSGV